MTARTCSTEQDHVWALIRVARCRIPQNGRINLSMCECVCASLSVISMAAPHQKANLASRGRHPSAALANPRRAIAGLHCQGVISFLSVSLGRLTAGWPGFWFSYGTHTHTHYIVFWLSRRFSRLSGIIARVACTSGRDKCSRIAIRGALGKGGRGTAARHDLRTTRTKSN